MEQLKKRSEIEEKYKWDLTKIYKSNDDVNKDIECVKKLVKDITCYKGKLLDNSDNFALATKLYFEISRKLEKLAVYSTLSFHEDLSDSTKQNLVGIVDKLTDYVSSSLAFYVPEVLEANYDDVFAYVKENKDLEEYQFYFQDLFREKEHSLSLKEEELLANLGEALSSFSNTYDVLSDVDLTFDDISVNGERKLLDESSYYRFIRSNDRNVRKQAFVNLYLGYGKFKNTYTEIFKGSIKSDTFIAKTRKYKSALDMALSSLNIDVDLYHVLISKTNDNLNLLHDYISLRKKVMNLDEIHLYDLYCPLVSDDDSHYNYEDGKNLVVDALGVLGSTYCDDLKHLFDSRSVDVYHTENKKSSAYSFGCYDADPYVLLNYEGTFNDVSTLAHEMGHAMHSYYSNANQSYVNASYTLFLAEIASQTNEILLNSYCYKNASSKSKKQFYLNNLLEVIRTAFYRQVMFAEFEEIVHSKDESGEVLTTDILCDIYYDLNKKYFGNDIVIDKDIAYEWIRISHFYRSFYVYMYATGIAVATRIANDILDGKQDAKENYLKFLQSGGKTYSLDILKNVGIDIINDDTIDQVFVLFKRTLEEFEKTL